MIISLAGMVLDGRAEGVYFFIVITNAAKGFTNELCVVPLTNPIHIAKARRLSGNTNYLV